MKPQRSSRRAAAFALLVQCLAAASAPALAGAKDDLYKLFDDHHQWGLRESPETAMRQGDYSQADRLDDESIESIERRHAERQAFLARLQAINAAELTPADRLNRALFERLLSDAIGGHEFRTYLMPIGSRDGPHQEIAQLNERVRFQSAADFENYLARLEATPRKVQENLARLREGLKLGLTPPQVVLQDVPQQLARLTAEGGLAALAEPMARLSAAVGDDAKAAAIRKRFEEKSLPAVRAALAELEAYVRDEYVPKSRSSIAAIDLPRGAELYAHRLRVMTTTNLTAKQIHEIGLSEVARIRAEMMQVIRKCDFLQKKPEAAKLDDAALFAAFVTYLRTDPRFYHATPAALVAEYRDICKQIDAHMPRLFGKLPRLPYGVREIPAFMAPSQTTAYYQQGDIRNAEPGYFYCNTYKLDQRPRYEMKSLAIHEAVPGHHHQVALAQEMTGVPEFRKEYWITAFGEGWGLYSERLGIEMGLYADPYDDFGRLTYEMWRACRLVVDPGIHALGWSREQAVKFMLDNSALSELNINAEVDRYISWPGQATAYKIGELKIRELRTLAEKELGAKFDLRGFHDCILEEGCLPLDILETRVKEWIASRQARAAATR